MSRLRYVHAATAASVREYITFRRKVVYGFALTFTVAWMVFVDFNPTVWLYVLAIALLGEVPYILQIKGVQQNNPVRSADMSAFTVATNLIPVAIAFEMNDSGFVIPFLIGTYISSFVTVSTEAARERDAEEVTE